MDMRGWSDRVVSALKVTFFQRKWLFLLLAAVLAASVFAVKVVFADKEKHIYIFPTIANADDQMGYWQNVEQALRQDLSSEASFADFSTSTSASILLGQFAATSSLGFASSSVQTDGGEELLPSPVIQHPPVIPDDTILQDASSSSNAIPSETQANTTTQSSLPTMHTFGAMPAFIEKAYAQSPAVISEESTSSATSTVIISSGAKEDSPVCATLGVSCHLLSFSGFGVVSDITTQPISAAALYLSIASRGGVSNGAHDRIFVRGYISGNWEQLGTVDLGGDQSNAERGGYIKIPLSSLTTWNELATAKVVVEYLHESTDDAAVYLDGAWIDVAYQQDITSGVDLSQSPNIQTDLSAADAQARRERRDRLDISNREPIFFAYSDSYEGQQLTVKVDRPEYHPLEKGVIYANVTNTTDAAEDVHVQFHVPNSGERITKVEQWAHDVPFHTSQMTYGTTGYFCSAGWTVSTSSSYAIATTTSSAYQCADTNEVRSCDALNDDATNCLSTNGHVGVSEDIEFRDGWKKLAIKDGSYTENIGALSLLVQSLMSDLPGNAIPDSAVPAEYVGDTLLLEPGQTVYLRISYDVPFNTKGDLFIEAAGESGVFGLKKISYNGSWNAKKEMRIVHDEYANGTYVFPISLDNAGNDFWDHVATSGADVRFVDPDSGHELLFALRDWDQSKHHAVAWVRVPHQAGATTTLDLYYGDHDATYENDLALPLRTDDLTPRYVVFGDSSQKDQLLVVTALDNDVHVHVGGRQEVLLQKDEQLVLTDVVNGEVVYADGAISGYVHSVGGGASLVPAAFASDKFAVPELGSDALVAFSSIDDDVSLIATGRTSSSTIDVVSGSVASAPIASDSAVSLEGSGLVVATGVNAKGIHSPMYPATRRELYGVKNGKTSIAVASPVGAFSLRCEKGARADIDGRLVGLSWDEHICQEGDLVDTEAVVVGKFSVPTGVYSYGLPGRGPVAYLPEEEMQHEYLLASDARKLVAVCPEESDSSIGMFDSHDNLLDSGECHGRAGYPGKYVFANSAVPIQAGYHVRTLSATSSPFMLLSLQGGAVGGEWESRLVNVWGLFQSRGIAPVDQNIQYGTEEFVIPGEHRAIDVRDDGELKKHVNDLLNNKREFSKRENLSFQFKYHPQSAGFIQGIRSAFGVAPFTIAKVSVEHASLGKIEGVPIDVTYGENDEWSVSINDKKGLLRPGKYTLKVEIDEGESTYTDEFDFYWGLIAVNYDRSIFIPGDTAHVMIGALSNNGNTICDAKLKTWITPPSGVEEEVPVTPSGKCFGNNVVDVPDYSATYRVEATGTYAVKIVRLNEDGNLESQVNDSFTVVPSVPYVIERIGPTRIYPVAHYQMIIRVRALSDFSGKITERVPGDFVFIDRGNADLERDNDQITATWGAILKKGDVVDYAYTFDAPDVSPYLYLLGPLSMIPDSGEVFSEARAWQIASDAAGNMLIFWNSNSRVPTGWTCVSCTEAATFYRKFAVGSSTYGLTGGIATNTPTATAVVYQTSSTGVGPATTNNTNNAALTHSHSFTPLVSTTTSNFPAYYELRVLRSTSAGEPASIPTGAILPFDVASSSLPSNWYRYAEMDGRYPMGASSTNVTGGANTHSHTVYGTLGLSPESGYRSQNGVVNGASAVSHSHTLTSTSTDVLNNEPPYREILFARLTSTSSPSNYMIGMWDDTPPNEWQVVSSTSTALESYFLKATSTYGGTGGATAHTHRDITGATTGGPSVTTNYTANASNWQAPSTHVHSVDISSFSSELNIPPYVSVIFAKRLTGISSYTQQDFWFYANTNSSTPSDPWPSGGNDLGENDPISSAEYSVIQSDVLRIRMNIAVQNSTSTVGRDAFKLQYATSSDCSNALNWEDVAPEASTTVVWRGYDNNNVGAANNTTLSSYLLSSSTVAELYVEQNNSTGTPNQIGIGEVGEYDWVVQAKAIAANANYCFRMVRSDGTPLDNYTNYPLVLTNASPNVPSLEYPYNNEKVGTTSPTMQFVAIDNEGNDLDYEVQISTQTTFGSITFDATSTENPELFINVNDSVNKAPFYSGNSVSIKVSPALASSTTYWWRVRAKDTNGSNTWGEWSSLRSFTTDTTVRISTWFQTTKEQFQTDTPDGTEATQTDQAMLITGSSTGWLYTSAINFADHDTGTAWGSFSFSDDRTNGTMRYFVEYQDATSGWALIPDADLPSNSSGFGSSPVSLLSVNADTYPTLRIRGAFTNSFGTPKLNDWTVAWAYNVDTPTLYTPFDNQIVASTSPYLEFYTTDPQSDRIVYQVSWSTSPTFTSSSTRTSDIDPGFRNIASTTNTSPFISGDRIRYVFQPTDALTASTTYFWKVRGIDPSGGNTWSFWSNVYSMTPGTWARTGIWYQTVDGQFDTDDLTSTETYSANRVRVATSTREVMVAYAEGTAQTPKYRIWSGTAWGTQADALSVGSQIYWTVLRASPLIGTYALGTLGTNRDVNVQIYNDGTWGNKQLITGTETNYNRRGFDLAYEQVSGKLMVVSCDGDPDPSYMTWDGTSWSATGTVNISSVSNCEWVRLAAKPGDNEIIMLERNTGSRYEAQVWNATSSTWGNAITLGSMTEFSHEGMAVEYENSGNQGMIVTSNANTNSIQWRTWSGTAWSATATQATTDDLEWGILKRGVATDTLALCYTNNVSSQAILRWDSSAWLANTDLGTGASGGSKNNNRAIDCDYENQTGRTGYILATYSTNTQAAFRDFNYTTRTWSAAAKVPTSTSPITTSAAIQTERAQDGKILAMFLSTSTNRYDFSYWASSTWSTLQTLESNSSVTAVPYAQPFYLAAKNPATLGTIVGTSAYFPDGNAPGWKRFYWTDVKSGASTLKYQLQYLVASTTWTLVPDAALTGNSAGFSTGPVNISTLDPTTYSSLRLVGNATCSGGVCPYLDDWTIEWAQGITIYGTAKLHDLTTATTSGTVAVAVNGVLQSGKTGTIAANGQWQIDNVTVFPGNIVTVWVNNTATSSRSVAIAKYVNAGDFGGFSLNQNWVTIGSASSTGQTMTLTDLSQYDNSVSGSNDIFYDVTAGGDMSTCVAALSAGCSNAGIYVLSGTTFRPNASAAKTVTTYDMRIVGGITADGNTFKVGGDWVNTGGFTANTSTVVFNATSTTRSIDQTSAATSTFYNVTIGESGNQGTTTLSSAFTATGTLLLSYNVLSPGNNALTLQGDLTIGASGTLKKGNATTTFSGNSAKTITDSSAGQDLGNVLIDGTAKTVNLGSNIKVSTLTIGADDTLDTVGAYTISVLNHWVNNNVFTARTGTVTMLSTSTGRITQGNSSFYNLTFNGTAGAFSFTGTNATATNDLTISAGTLTAPSGTLEVGGSFNNSGGTFTSGTGIVRMTSTSGSKTIRANGSSFYELQCAGSGGGWSFADTNATSTASTTIIAGTLTLPTGTLAVGDAFVNVGGVFTSGTGIVRMTAASGVHNIRTGGSALATLQIGGAGTFNFPENNATATQDIAINQGTLVFPFATLNIGGSFTNSSTFTSGTSTVLFTASSGSKSISPGGSSFSNVGINGAGTFTITQNATATNAFNINSSGGFTVNTGLTLAVGGAFMNLVGGAATTWTGSTLYLNSGTNYTINTKTLGGDSYGTIKTGPNTQVRSWASSASAYTMDSTGSLYSQNHASTSGALNIYGYYTKTSGIDYWSYATDFDGSALGSPRAVSVSFGPSATTSYVGAQLQILGGATATTTIDRESTGNYAVQVNGGTLNAQYYQFRNMGQYGLHLLASTTVTSLRDGDFQLSQNGSSMMTVASTTIDTNPALQIFSVKFATSTGITSGYNVTETGTAISYWRFKQHSGNYAGENYDNDPGGNPGYVRWDDSNFVISISGNVYSDAGVTGMGAPTCDGVTNVVRVKVDGAGSFAAPCTAGTGEFTVPGVSFTGDTVMTIYLDTNGGDRAVTVTRSAVSDLSGIKLYKNRVIVRHEDVFPITIANLDTYDGGNDSDIPFTATLGSPSTLVVKPDTEFWIWSGMTFVPGGNITTQSGGTGNTYDGSFHIDNGATFTAQGTETHSVGGRFAADSGATFTAASSTFYFTATTSSKTITGLSTLTFNDMVFNGVGGVWPVSINVIAMGNVTLLSGTVSGTADMNVRGTTVTGGGAFAMTAGTFTLEHGGTFGGSVDWSFNNLTFSGGSATTSKTGSSTVSVAGVLTISSGHTLFAGTSTTWNMAGGGTPFVVSGSFVRESSVFVYSGTTATTLTPQSYYRLKLAPSATGTPTYTMSSGYLYVLDAFSIGDGTYPVIVNMTTNDPNLTLYGDFTIRPNTIFIASDSGTFSVAHDWVNQGNFTGSNGTVTFIATSTGRSINAGISPFSTVVFNSTTGGWTISANATTSSAFTLTQAQSLAVAPGVVLEIDGTFTNSLGGSVTTWTGSTLYLNSGTAYSINTRSAGDDLYDRMDIGANTKVSMWNSDASTTNVNASGSLYSQNHSHVSGDLYIWGSYARTSGTDYWDYETDFDGTALFGPTRRVVNVRFAPSASYNLSGSGALELIGGTTTATTTIDRQSSGNYAFNISGGSTTMQFASFRNVDSNGLNISGTPVINVINDSDFELGVNAGSMITVTSAAIDANALKTFYRNRFATSTGISSGYNVKATGAAVSAWRFNLAYGNYSGEAYDSDPGGDPGYIIWDDSAANITISGNVYADEGKTFIGALTCDGVSQVVRLKVQGAGSYASACDGSGAFSISNVIFNPGDTLTLYLDTNGGARAANVTIDPSTNIANMHLYQNRVIVRHEDTGAITIAKMIPYDSDQDSDIPFNANVGSPNTLSLRAGTGLIIWDSKTFNPGGNITLAANATANAWDGTLHLNPGSTLSGSTETHTIGGSFIADNAATISLGSAVLNFVASTTGKVIIASSTQTFGPITWNGTGGGWNASGIGTSTGDLTLTAGSVTLPSGTLSVGGSLTTTGGSFDANGGTLRFTSTAAGKTISANGSQFGSLEFTGTGGTWTMTDTNATSTGSVTIARGTLNLLAGTFAVRGNFDNQGGTFTGGSGTVKMTAPGTTATIHFNGSSFNNLYITGTSTFTIADTYATTSSDLVLSAGTTTMPYNTLAIGGSFSNAAIFSSGTSTVLFTATSGSKTIDPGSSSFYNLGFSGAGTFTVSSNATSTNNTSINTAGGFTLSSGKTLAVGGTFTNLVGGAPTTWTGSTLSLYSGGNYTINTKTLGGDVYDTIRISSSTQIRSWGSSATTVSTDPNSSLYSQNNGGSSGSLYIYGNYSRTTGTDYWSYAADFDGTVLSGGSRRQVNVRFASGATSTYQTASTLQIIGDAAASTSIDRISSGSYAITLDSSYLNASYYQFRNLGQYGLDLTGTTTITTMNYGDFELGQTGGTMLRLASTTIDQNASSQFFTVRFATSTGVNSGANVTRVGTTTSAITFQQHYGNFAGESYDNDGTDACGSIRWTDSACLFVDQNHYRFRNDDGGEGVPSTEWYNASWSKRKRITITNTSTTTLTNIQVKLNVLYDSDMQSNFNDIRFTDSSGTTTIPHWIQDYVSSASSTVWVKVPSIAASATADIFMYYGNGSAISSSSGTTTFTFFDDFEDNNITEYTGDTSLFGASASFNYERSYGLAPSAGNTGAKTTDGIHQVSAGIGQGSTLRFYQYIDMSTGGSDESCVLFAVQSPASAHQNYAVCLQPFGQDKIVVAKDAANNGRSDGATQLVQKNVTYSTGWYETNVDWLPSGRIDVNVYDSTGAFFASTTATSSTYSTGGIGFSFWGQHGGWDVYLARNYYPSKPTAVFGLEQTNSGASWKVAEDTALTNQLVGSNIRLRFTIKNSGTPITNQLYRLQMASKGVSANCESVASGNYSDVPSTTSVCGSSAACIVSSSNFTDKSSTTQQLSVATGFTFVEGEIMKDPSNQTNALSLGSNELTEVEYNFQMTAFSNQASYCFRVANGTTALDNYSRVAELRPLYPPTISNWSFNSGNNIALTEGTATRIYATATVSDLNGYTDIVAASSTFYRSGVTNARACTVDENACYQIATTSCLMTNCSGNSCDLSCSSLMQYFTDPTDAGSTYASEFWDAFVDIWDLSGTHTTSSSSEDVYTLRGLSTASTIDYGNVTVGNDTGSTNASTTINNTGNSLLNLLVVGKDLINGTSYIPVTNEKYATSSFTYNSCTVCNALSTATTSYDIGVPKPTSTSPFFRDIFWGISVPLGVSATTHNGVNTFMAN